MSIAHNLREFERGLSDLALKQIPFATSLALNDTAETIKVNTEKTLDRRLDRPTPFTRRGLLVLRSSRSRLAVTVLFKDRQASYLKQQETGGTRRPAGRAIPVPVKIRLNAYGNMARKGVVGALARADTFSGRPGRGTRAPGIYRRKPGGGLELLVAWGKQATYRPRLHFVRDASKTAARYLPIALDRAMRRALATAKP